MGPSGKSLAASQDDLAVSSAFATKLNDLHFGLFPLLFGFRVLHIDCEYVLYFAQKPAKSSANKKNRASQSGGDRRARGIFEISTTVGLRRTSARVCTITPAEIA